MAPCLICAAEVVTPTYELEGYRVYRCGRCDFAFNGDFRPGDEEGACFAPHYFTEWHRAAFAAALENYRQDPSVPVFVRRLDQIEEQVPIGRLLDVGCGPGTFLRLAKERGWQASGVEVSRFAATHARTCHDLDVFVGDLSGFEAADQSFDVVTFWDSLEHVSAPLPALRAAWRLLRPGGLLLVATDNFDCLIAGLARAARSASFGTVIYPMRRVFIDRNRSYFTLANLRRLLDMTGFREIRAEKMEYPLAKIQTNTLERVALQALYLAAAALRRQAQVTLLAVRP